MTSRQAVVYNLIGFSLYIDDKISELMECFYVTK